MADFEPSVSTNSSYDGIGGSKGEGKLSGDRREFEAGLVDYAMIFGSLQVLKKCNSTWIPVLDQRLTVDGGSEDAPSSSLDYSEVFGGVDASDFAVYYENLFLHVENLSENNRSTAEMCSLQQTPVSDFGDDFDGQNQDPYAYSDKREILSNGALYDISSEISKTSNEYSVTRIYHTPHFHNRVEINSFLDSCAPPENTRGEKSSLSKIHEMDSGTSFKGMISEKEDFKETETQSPVYSSKGLVKNEELCAYLSTTSEEVPESDLSYQQYFHCDTIPVGCRSYPINMFLTVSDINLQTEPSQLLPPCKLPPKLAINRGDFSNMVTPNFRAHLDETLLPRAVDQNGQSGFLSEDNVLEKYGKNIMPPFFDIEIDSSSAALTSSTSVIEAMKPRVEEQISQGHQNFLNGAWKRERNEVKDLSVDERPGFPRVPKVATDIKEKDEHLETSKYIDERKWNNSCATLTSYEQKECAFECNKKELHEPRLSFKAPEDAPRRKASKKKKIATIQVCEMNVAEVDYVQHEKYAKCSNYEMSDKKIEIGKEVHEQEWNRNKLGERRMTSERKVGMKLKQTCQYESMKMEKETVEVTSNYEENGCEMEEVEKVSRQEEIWKKLKEFQVAIELEACNSSECGGIMKTIVGTEYGAKLTKTEKLEAAAARNEDETSKKLSTAGEASNFKANEMIVKQDHENRACENETKSAEKACDQKLFKRELKTSDEATEHEQMEILKLAKELHGLEQAKKNIREAQIVLALEDDKTLSTEKKNVFSWLENGKKLETRLVHNLVEKNGATSGLDQHVATSQNKAKKEKNASEIYQLEKDGNQERQEESDWLKSIEENETAWKTQKKMTPTAFDSAPLEVQEREETEVVKNVSHEVEQRATSEDQNSIEKVATDFHESSFTEKTSIEAKICEEGGGIWHRDGTIDISPAGSLNSAAEPASTEEIFPDSKKRALRSLALSRTTSKVEKNKEDETEKFVAVANCGGFDNGHTTRIQKTNTSSSSTQTSSNATNEMFPGADCVPTRRYQARLERHRRTIERAAKALAQKKFHDILVQREHAERNRLAETLDADLRRWSNGKEGNLRALLSTLQYILGPESGWRPIPLSDVIKAVDVKKAYRKAVFCVHPDKVQQRSANIQQKYMCEKVYDLLKDAWSKFNSEGC